MTTVAPEGEAVRKAVRWIAERLQDNPQASALDLAGRAAERFDLTPLQTEQLLRFYRNSPGQ